MNYVQVMFLETRSVPAKAYTYKNNCDLLEGDFAVVTVAGILRLVRVTDVSDRNKSQFTDEQLKTVTGAVYLDPAVQEERRIAMARELALRDIHELEKVAEARRRLCDIREDLSAKDRARLDEARRTLGM